MFLAQKKRYKEARVNILSMGTGIELMIVKEKDQ